MPDSLNQAVVEELRPKIKESAQGILLTTPADNKASSEAAL